MFRPIRANSCPPIRNVSLYYSPRLSPTACFGCDVLIRLTWCRRLMWLTGCHSKNIRNTTITSPVLAGRGQEISVQIIITSTRASSTESEIVPVHKEWRISIYWFKLMFACVRTHVYISSERKNRMNISRSPQQDSCQTWQLKFRTF